MLALGLAAVLGLGGTPASAQTITVTTLTDSADPPFDADGVCGTGTVDDLPGADGLVSLREAIVAANNTAGTKTITFDLSLSGGTLLINFDDLDADTDPDPLPNLCGGNTTLDGDLDGDNVPDITLDGSALLDEGADGVVITSNNNTVNGLRVQNVPNGGIGVRPSSSNTISNNIVSGGNASIFVNPDAAVAIEGVTFNNITIIGNTVSGPAGSGLLIALITDGSSMKGITITDNEIADSAGVGIFFFTFSSNTVITNTTITDNKVMGNNFGIAVEAFGDTNSITNTTITDNEVIGNDFIGIFVGSLQGDTNSITNTTITDNEVMGNRSGIEVALDEGDNNSITGVTIARNSISDNNIGIGLFGGANGANGNTLSAAVTENILTGNGSSSEVTAGISIMSGILSSSGNRITVRINNNTVMNNEGVAINATAGQDNSSTNSLVSAQK
jgi:hypothetical protein